MLELWSSASYEPHVLSLPFALAPVAMLFVIAYALVMRGATVLRIWLVVHFGAILPYALCMTLSPSLRSQAASAAMFRCAAAFIPLAAAAGAGFQFALLGWRPRTRIYAWAGVAAALVWIIVGLFTHGAVDDVRWVRDSFWYATPGNYAWLGLVTTAAVSLPGFAVMLKAALRSPPSEERRQLRLVLAANAITYAGLVDVAIAFHVDLFPLGWLSTAIGSVLVIRALLVENLLRARAFDTTAPRLVLHLGAASVLGALVLALLGPQTPWWGATLVLVLACAGARVIIAVIGLVSQGPRGNDTMLDRLVTQLAARGRDLHNARDAARLAIDIVELGIGTRIEVLLAAADDWSWTTVDGSRLADDASPDPLILGWLAEEHGAKFADELAYVPDDLRDLLGQLYARHAARSFVPVANGDELLALVVVPATARRLRGRALAFVDRVAERLAEALIHARMAKRAAEAAAAARDVELAAAVQTQLLPGKAPHVHGDVTVVGSWLPATHCAGDFWSVHPLGGERVLVVIGDVTGHGVASATVTAAASAACEIVARRYGAALELPRLIGALDAAVRRVGGGQLAMSCFAAILDPIASEVRFVSCGHTAPYLCRTIDSGIELQALVGRGNPLGGAGVVTAKVQQKALRAGDIVVWYTDGVIEAMDPGGEEFGDRRLQRMLRRLDHANFLPAAVHAVVHAGVAAHRAGRSRNDDETIVVAQWRPA